MNSEWVKIYTSNQFFKSEIVRQVLVDNEIEAVIINKQDSSYKFGEVEVHVRQADFQKASEIILTNDL
jgi:Putative prokaryotic signal transducing protein